MQTIIFKGYLIQTTTNSSPACIYIQNESSIEIRVNKDGRGRHLLLENLEAVGYFGCVEERRSISCFRGLFLEGFFSALVLASSLLEIMSSASMR